VEKKKDGLCREFGLENFRIQTIWKDRTKISSPLIRTHREHCGFLKSERSDVDKLLLKEFKQERSDSVPVSGTLLMIIFVRPKI